MKYGLHEDHCKYLGINSFRVCPVPHFKPSYAMTMDIPYTDGDQNSFKLSFSGDTLPSKDFLRLGRDSSLLIHEATFQDELATMAKQKNHSTVSQAIETGRLMNAKYTILTHFSQRYVTMPYIERELNSNVGIAFDYMEITIPDLPRLNSLYPKYKNLFEEEWERMKSRTNNYILQQEFDDD